MLRVTHQSVRELSKASILYNHGQKGMLMATVARIRSIRSNPVQQNKRCSLSRTQGTADELLTPV
jgi:hypothetical protein